MIRIPTDAEKARFAELCEAHSFTEVRGEGFSGIGTYNEKRVHRVIKEFVSSDPETYEIKLGGAVADVFAGGVITEIQTGSFFPLSKKVAAYLENTEHEVCIVHPAIVKKTIVRVDPLTGEVIRKKASPKKERPSKILPELIYLADHLRSHRLTFEIYSITVEEHRYSDEIHRYRKSGKRDSELFPVSLEAVTTIETTDDFLSLLPKELVEKGKPFTAAEFARASGIGGRYAYNSLGALCAAGVLIKEKEGKKAAIYKFV